MGTGVPGIVYRERDKLRVAIALTIVSSRFEYHEIYL